MILGVEIIIWTYFESILLGVNFPIFGHFREFTRPQWALWGSLRGRYLGFVYYSNGLSRKWSGFEKFHFWLEGFRCLLAAMHVKITLPVINCSNSFLSEPFQFFPLGVRSSIKRRKKCSLCFPSIHFFSVIVDKIPRVPHHRVEVN